MTLDIVRKIWKIVYAMLLTFRDVLQSHWRNILNHRQNHLLNSKNKSSNIWKLLSSIKTLIQYTPTYYHRDSRFWRLSLTRDLILQNILCCSELSKGSHFKILFWRNKSLQNFYDNLQQIMKPHIDLQND